ncbi:MULTISPECIES: T9SS type A sorting domain-containing protein [unclassified Lentimicrobium]|uniref:T9SS type A sorting domain-containing protein n=1 Tax=unclassified Lentimicrobium TaxID=2677434 RepID=UPI0015579C70|nr:MULTISPECIES: T9SS type A sorting domain-containing protein [unclassified Lentimicrobium]NPD47669.1 T9SS type A sorting domain-containing protein [Lentimicrobium sp. S6]NPD86623.1 T9SS type A sorting domain-containing protein [Lentimicrobium sp. L6]
MRIIYTLGFLFIFWSLSAQDTIQIMQYNLLNYGNYYGDCTTSNNNVNSKNGHLRTIIDYVKPDIFTVNELSDNTTYHQMILDQVLNTDGVDYYRKAVSFNAADSYIVNMLYFNKNKLALYSQDVVYSAIRDIDVFTLYYKAADLGITHDTAFITCFVAHLKAGNSDSDASKRAGMVASAMTYIRTHDLPENMLFMGDLNLYTSEEQAYTNLTYTYNGIRYFYDPINQEGNWNNNYSYRHVHTQSTHGNNSNCFSSGGLDDRFDFIMSTASLLEGTNKMKLLTDTYHPLGNDGEHFNGSITDSPTNTSAPINVINALYGMSDHLPILVQIEVDAVLGTPEQVSNINSIQLRYMNAQSLQYTIGLEQAQKLKILIYDIFGRQKLSFTDSSNQALLSGMVDISKLNQGFYLFVVVDENGRKSTTKFIKK